MKRLLIKYLMLALAASVLAFTSADARERGYGNAQLTLKTEMEALHQIFGVNFIYDSSLALDVPYKGKPMEQIVSPSVRDDKASLEKCLKTLFTGSGIEYEIMKKYVVLTKSGAKKEPKEYTIFIEERLDTLTASRITALVDAPVNSTQTGLERIDGSKISRGFAFMSSPDVIKTLQTLPGVAGGTEMLSGLYVHGGTGSDNLYLMDGVPLYSVGHLAGLFSSFNSDVIDKVDFYKSGFPARYGGRMSSVVDVTVRDGDFDDYKGSFSVGLIEGRFQLEGPLVKGKTSFNVGMRRSWIDVLTVPAFAIYNLARNKETTSHTDMRYAMTDFNGKITHRFSDHNTLSLSLFAGQDALASRLDNNKGDWENKGTDELTDIGIRWGNLMASLSWKNRVSDTFRYTVNAYHVTSLSRISLEDYWKYRYDDGSIKEVDNYDRYSTPVYDTGLKADFRWVPSDVHSLRFGAETVWHVFKPYRYSERNYSHTGYDSVSEEGKEEFRYHGVEPSLYLEDEMTLTDWLSANLGLRYVMFMTPDRNYHRLEPRAALRFRLGDIASLKLSYSDMNQFNHRLKASTPLDLPTSLWMPSTSMIAPMHSRQYSAGTSFNLPYGIRLELEGWYKSMNDIREYVGVSSLYPPIEAWEDEYAQGRGRAYGLDAQVEWNDDNIWLSLAYTLSWSERFFDGIHDEWFYDMFDNRHKINISATRRIGRKTEVYAGWTFRSGNRMTLPSQILPLPNEFPEGSINYDYVQIYTSPNNIVLPPYHRLDVGFNFHKTTKRGNESVWNLSVYNAYCHMNAINAWVRETYDGSGPEKTGYVSEMAGWFPIIPTFSYTLKF